MARHDQLVVTQVDGETIVYDQPRHAIHHLNPTSQAIWTLCDGTRTLPDIAQAAGLALRVEVSTDVVRLALGQLGTANLLVGPIPTAAEPARHSRRTMLRRMAAAGGVALPALASISAPVAANHGSCHALGTNCTTTGDCCRGTCAGGTCCVVRSQPCNTTSECCGGDVCTSGTCTGRAAAG